jgi:hypothetical protein
MSVVSNAGVTEIAIFPFTESRKDSVLRDLSFVTEVRRITSRSSEEVGAATPWGGQWHTVTNALSYPKAPYKISAVVEIARQNAHSVENSQV